MRKLFLGRAMHLWMAGGSILLLGGCNLTDQQLTSVYASVLTSGLSALVSAFITALANATQTTTGG